MRSYHAHLATTAPLKEGTPQAKPVFRSSAIFPAIQMEGITTEILFMGYWILKRHIEEIATVVSLRDERGNLIKRDTFSIVQAKTYRILLEDFVGRALFIGSIEVEFFSTKNLVFPYPAVAVNYKGPHFSSVVHTAQRVYNDLEDEMRNSQTNVPESGFNIYVDEDHEPFLGMINGARTTEKSDLKMTFYNGSGETLEHTLELGTLAPYATKMIYPAREIDLQPFLKGKVGAAKISFHLNGIFPRIIAGNFQKSLQAAVITHTYYDCTKATSDSDYWFHNEDKWVAASLMIPLTIGGDNTTNIYFYPIYSPSEFFIDVEIYDSNGNLLSRHEEILHIKAPDENFHKIDFKALCEPTSEPLAARVIARSKEGERIPSRIKIALDLGANAKALPCNICTNLQPFVPGWETKPFTFKWAPILADQPSSPFWIMNSAPNVVFEKSAAITLTFFREADTQTLVRSITLPPHGFACIDPSEDLELKTFFGGHVGWVTALSSNPYTTTYYFAINPSGIVGGDHGF